EDHDLLCRGTMESPVLTNECQAGASPQPAPEVWRRPHFALWPPSIALCSLLCLLKSICGLKCPSPVARRWTPNTTEGGGHNAENSLSLCTRGNELGVIVPSC